jgi:receptor protein-tyrosine kinase
VKSQEDVTELTGSAVMGTIAFDPVAVKQPLVTDLGTHAPRVEAFRVLRTNMQFVNVDSDSKVFAVTSSLPSEGKTTTACNLAITLAQTGQRVLLIEADLRRPKVADTLQLESVVGLTTVLVGRIGLEDAVQEYSVENLSVLTSGAIPPNPSELLQSQAMADVLDEVRKAYDVIIVDAPPLLPVTDAALLTAQSDGALIVVRHGKTTKDQLRHSMERLEAVEGRALGVVLNMIAVRRGGGAYGGGYGYGYGYAPEPGPHDGSKDEAASTGSTTEAETVLDEVGTKKS